MMHLHCADHNTILFTFRNMSEVTANGVDFKKEWAYSDIVFMVEDKKVYASKMILSMWSPVFEAMFSDNFKEKNAKEINLPGKIFEDVVEMMDVLHPPNKEIEGVYATNGSTFCRGCKKLNGPHRVLWKSIFCSLLSFLCTLYRKLYCLQSFCCPPPES